MTRSVPIVATPLLALTLFAARDHAQTSTKVDFVRDVQPIFREQCYDCHGPSQQMNGFRLDRRRDAMRGGTIAVIGPGNSEGSRLYQKLIGNKYGSQMPPTGALTAEQVALIRGWIDQGAEWPDSASGEAAPLPTDPVVDTVASGDVETFAKLAADNPNALNLRGPGGTTPLMAAAAYADAATVRRLLDAGADPNIRNDAGATALIWAAGDVEKATVLIAHGADVNARSADNRTPLLVAAARPARPLPSSSSSAAARPSMPKRRPSSER